MGSSAAIGFGPTPALKGTSLSPAAVAKARATSQDFEAMFLNSMFSQMTSGVKGDGPFGDTVGTGIWRSMLTEIEQLQIEPDLPAKIIIDERSGIIVMGRDVRVSTVAVAQGNLTVSISETPQVSQPAPFSQGRTVVVPRSKVGVTEDGKKLALVREGVSLQQLVDGLNALGIGPRDMIAILQAIKAAGAIQADIEVM